MIYGYARVSSKGQAKDGYSLEAQEKELRKAGASEVFSDAFTGTKNNRPELDKLLNKMQSGDRVIVTKFDRIARSLTHGIELIDGLNKRGITVHVLDMGIIDDSATGRLIRNSMLSIAEFERDMIQQRMDEGKAISGNYGGRPKKFTKKRLDYAVNLLNDYSYSQVVEMTGMSKSTLQRAKRESEDRIKAYYDKLTNIKGESNEGKSK